jgi:hypothetical protein
VYRRSTKATEILKWVLSAIFNLRDISLLFRKGLRSGFCVTKEHNLALGLYKIKPNIIYISGIISNLVAQNPHKSISKQ